MSIHYTENIKRILANKESEISSICREYGIRKLYIASQENEDEDSTQISLLGLFHANSFFLDEVNAEIDLERILKVEVRLESDNMNYHGFLEKLVKGAFFLIYEEG